MRRPTEIWRSDSGPMARATMCFPLTAQRSAKQKWIANKSLYIGNINGYSRILAHVYWRTMHGKRCFLMDAITGTLYRKSDGQCYTSDTLKILSITKDKDISKKLLKMRISQYGGDEE